MRIKKKISTFAPILEVTMEIKFDETYLEELFFAGQATDKKYRFQPQIIKKYRKTIDMLESVKSVEDLFRYNSLRY